MSIEARKLAIEAMQQAIEDAEKQEPDDLTIAYMSGFHAGKNTPQRKPEQEPVAWMREDEDCTDCIVWEQTEEHTIPLYTTPPQPKPLTDEQLIAAYESEQQGRYGDHIRALRAIEAKLREENG